MNKEKFKTQSYAVIGGLYIVFSLIFFIKGAFYTFSKVMAYLLVIRIAYDIVDYVLDEKNKALTKS